MLRLVALRRARRAVVVVRALTAARAVCSQFTSAACAVASASAAAPIRGVSSLSAGQRSALASRSASRSVSRSARASAATAAWPSIGARRGMFIQTQSSPNPRSMKFLPGCPVLGSESQPSTRDYQSAAACKDSLLAQRLFQIDGVVGVMLGADFVTINIAEDASWLVVKPNVFAAIMDFFATGQPVVRETTSSGSGSGSADAAAGSADSAVVSLIKELIETRIRPSVQDDGGDIEFKGFENGIVKVQMQGSCVGCPSSSVTLKNGIENMLMHYVPEVEGVEEWKDAALESVSEMQLKKLEERLAQAPAVSAASSTSPTSSP